MIENPIYGGAYAYGKTGAAAGYDAAGVRVKIRRKARSDWLALMPDAHEGYVSWERAEAIRKMVSDNVPTSRHHGAPKHGDALLAGLLRCRRCGRKLTLRYTGAKHHIPRYSCSRGWLDNGEPRCIAFGGLRVDDAIEEALLAVVGPGAIAAAVAAEKEASQRRDQVREALMRDLEAARYAADRAFRQYDAADPANRLVAGELEARWNKALARVAEVEGKIAAHDAAKAAPAVDPASLATLADDLKTVWTAPTTDARLKKRIVRTVIHEVIADIDRRGRRDHAPGPLDRRRPHRAAPAPTAARPAQQHLGRHRRRGPPTGADRQRRSDRRHPEPERADHRQRQSLDARARHLAALASPHPGLQARRRRHRTVAQPEQGRRAFSASRPRRSDWLPKPARSRRFILCRTVLGSSAAPRSRHQPARAIIERARQNPKHPTGSHPDQQNLFPSMA